MAPRELKLVSFTTTVNGTITRLKTATTTMTTRHRILLVTGFLSLGLATLPWLGFGCCAFAVPGIDLLVPRLSILDETTIPGGSLIYGVMETPLQILGHIPPIGALVFYGGEGVVRVRPFMIFVFWLIFGILAVWVAIRPAVMPSFYGHLRREPSPEYSA